MNKNIALLVTSFDGYNDLWEPLDSNFGIYVDKNIDCYLMTNFIKPNLKNLSYLDIGQDLSWSENLQKAINKISNYDYIFLTLDDVFFKKKLRYLDLAKYCNEMKKNNANYLSLLNRPSAKFIKINQEFSFISKDSLYPVSAGLCIWKLDELKNYLSRKNSAWEYEKTFKIHDEKNFMSLNFNFHEVIHLVVRGKLYPSAIKELEKQKIYLKTDRKRYLKIIEIFHIFRDSFRSVFIRLLLSLNLVNVLRFIRILLKK